MLRLGPSLLFLFILGLRVFNGLWEKPLYLLHKRFSSRGQVGLVSIPIATYDRVDTLVERTIPEILESSYPNLEVIIISDGTAPELLAPIRKITDSRVKLVELRNRSRYPRDPTSLWMVAGSRPRNIGARVANGEFLLWISDDDVLCRTAVEDLTNFLKGHPGVDAVGGRVVSRGKTAQSRLPSRYPALVGAEIGAMPGWLHRRHLRMFRWSRNSWRKKWNRPADYDLSERMAAAGVVFGAIDTVVCHQYPVPGTQEVGSKGAVLEELLRRNANSKPE